MKIIAVVAVLGLSTPAVAQSYRFPLDVSGGGAAPYITAYRDLSGSGGGLRDWGCGSVTYDGHNGTDIGIGGFAAMDAGSRWIVAAADGTVTAAVDGCFDRCTSGRCDCGAGFGNSVRITHADGKSTWYGHMMNGSLQVRNGERVTCGQRLGRVGSSGWSTGPHLHFEPRYADNTSDDPFSGQCGGPVSFWVSQGGYRGLPAEQCEGGTPPPPPPPPPPAKGMLKGVVFDRGVTAGPSDAGNVRVAGTVIAVESGPQVTARAGDAYFELELDPGTYTYEARSAGYVSMSRTVEVVAGQDVWGSVGIERVAAPPPPEEPPAMEPPPPEEPPAMEPPAMEPPAMEPPAMEPPANVGVDPPALEREAATTGGCSCVVAPSSSRAGAALVLIALALTARRRAYAR